MSIEPLDEPAEAMTQAQASYLQSLAAAAGDTFDSGLSKAAAAKRIAELERKTRRGPPQADGGDGGSSIRANESPSATESATNGPPQEEH